MGEISIRILRSNQEVKSDSFFQEYKIFSEEPLSILVILKLIQKDIDPTLAFRNSVCNRGICGSCFVKANGKIVRGCKTLVYPGENIILEPVSNYPVIRDLVVDFGV